MQAVDRRHFLSAVLGGLACAPLARLALANSGDSFVPLRRLSAGKGMEFGFALDPARLNSDPVYRDVVARQASIVVPENALKWEAVHPAAERYDFDGGDAIASFAAAHGQRMRGHAFCWHRAMPDWVSRQVTRGNAQAVLTTHIDTVAGHYRGKICAWDVVNEAIELKDGQPGGLRNAFWYQRLGPGYLDTAFHAAHQADPDAVLCYNDYGLESDTPESERKRAAVLSLLQTLKRRGVPVGALGLQSHLRAGQTHGFGSGLSRFIQSVHDLGLQVYVTELDVDDSQLGGPEEIRDAIVAQTYKRYLDTVLASGAVSTVLTWGVWDTPHRTGATASSGPPAQRPLVFGPGGAIKPASWVVEHCLAQAPALA